MHVSHQHHTMCDRPHQPVGCHNVKLCLKLLPSPGIWLSLTTHSEPKETQNSIQCARRIHVEMYLNLLKCINHNPGTGYYSQYSKQTTGWMTGVLFPVGARHFSLSYGVQEGSGHHLVSYPIGTGATFLGVKRTGRQANHLNFVTRSRISEPVLTPSHAFMA
jgi:hypothetical protein